MYTKTLGLVLRETEYKDADKLLTVLTKDRGKLTFRARGVRSRSSRLKSGCQLLAYSEFTVFENKNTMVVDEAVAQELFLPLRQDIELLALASYFTQVAETLAREEEPDEALLSLTLCRKKSRPLLSSGPPASPVTAPFWMAAASAGGRTRIAFWSAADAWLVSGAAAMENRACGSLSAPAVWRRCGISRTARPSGSSPSNWERRP